jgi:signal transduction histidine kinase
MTDRHTILVVDDEPSVVSNIRILLSPEHDVLGATSAEQGLELLRHHDVHVIMTDQNMPGLSGVEFVAQARADYPDAVRLMFTGHADLHDVIDAINEGHVYRYVIKPWDPDELLTTVRQAAEQYELRAERRRLLAELRARNLELEQANAELRRANELKDGFIKVASHELRTPLTILLNLVELARSSPNLGAPLADWLTGIHRASGRLNRTTNQLIHMLLAGKFERPLHRQATDLAALLRAAAEDVRPFVEQRQQRLDLDFDANVGTISVEADKVRDVVNNLLLNAIKFTPDRGSIRLAARRTAAGSAEIRVTDTGLGIDGASLPHVFEPFFTSFDVSRHASGHFEFGRRGLGLGLSLVRVFVEMHGGQVSVTSEPGRGSTFTVILPPTAPEG